MKKTFMEKAAYGFIMVVCAIWMVPLIWVILSAFKSNSEILVRGYQFIPKTGFTIESFKAVLANDQAPVIRWALNSLIVSVLHVALVLFIGSMAAFGYGRLRFKGKDTLLGILLGSMMIPGIANLIPAFKIVDSLGWIDNKLALIVPGVGSVFSVLIMFNFIKGIPMDLDEAARIDGANDFYIYSRIILPLMKPVLSVVGLLCFLGSWNDFFWPTIVMQNKDNMTITAGLRVIQGTYGLQPGNLMAATLISAIPVAIIFLIAQKNLMEGMALQSGIK